ncbi:AAA ATPase [Ancistrocladus abbreviatus]
MPSSLACREDERARFLAFCKSCIEQEKSGSLYVCGSPGTGKTMIMKKFMQSLADWSKEVLLQVQPQKKTNGTAAALKHIQNLSAVEMLEAEIKQDASLENMVLADINRKVQLYRVQKKLTW